MTVEYNGETYNVCPTKQDRYSIFHAAFGKRGNAELYEENIAAVRQLNWIIFLIFYKTKPRPPYLKNMLKDIFEERGRSVENDSDFEKYVDATISDDRQILPHELPIVATLDNIKIILFIEDKLTPTIIEPVAELSEGYPLVSTKSEETVVVFYNGEFYQKLSPQNAEIAEEECGEENAESGTFQKRHVGALNSIWYDVNLLAIALLNAFKFDTWRMSSNPADVDFFKTLILESGPTNSAFLLEAKWWKRKVYAADLSGNKYSGFSLGKHFYAYESLKEKYNVKAVVLCTNVDIQLGSFKEHVDSRQLNEDDLLYYEGAKSVCYTFRTEAASRLLSTFENYQYPSSVTEECVKSFIECLQIISLYPSGTILEEAIENKIVKMGLSGQQDKTLYARHLNKEIVDWYDKKDEYLTPSHAKAIFCGLSSDKLLEKLHSLGFALKPDTINITLTEKISHIIPQHDFVLSLLKVAQFLADKRSETLFLSTRESVFNQKLAAEAFQVQHYTYLVVCNTKRDQDFEELCHAILQVLDRFPHKKVILISDAQDNLARMLREADGSSFRVSNDEVKFTDFTEKSQELLLEKTILFYEASL